MPAHDREAALSMDVEKPQTADDLLDASVAESPLPVRTINTLENNGILTVRDLLHCCARTGEACSVHCSCREVHDESQVDLPVHRRRPFKAPVRLYSLENVGDKTVHDILSWAGSIVDQLRVLEG